MCKYHMLGLSGTVLTVVQSYRWHVWLIDSQRKLAPFFLHAQISVKAWEGVCAVCWLLKCSPGTRRQSFLSGFGLCHGTLWHCECERDRQLFSCCTTLARGTRTDKLEQWQVHCS